MQKDGEALNFNVCGLKIHLMIDWHQDRGQFWQFGGEGKNKQTSAVSVPLPQTQKCSSGAIADFWDVGKLFAKLDAS